MAKLRCKCGHVIVDQTDNIPYKGYILPDTQTEHVSAAISTHIDTLIEAIQSNKRLDWIEQNFSVPPYPTDLKNSDMIHDLLTGKLVATTQDIFECENCGRIAIQIGQTNLFEFFKPESDDSKGILKGKLE
jgi:hypothetical protein